MLAFHKVKLYSVGAKSHLLPEQSNEISFSGESVKELLLSIRSQDKDRTLYDELIDGRDNSYKHGYALAVNGELIRSDEIGKPVPNLSEVVVIHLMQIPGGG